MPKDEFKAIEKHIKELEVLKHYPKVKQERDSLATEAAQLRDKVAQLEAQLKSEISTKNELSSHLSKSEAEIRELARKLDEAQKELSSLKEFKVKLPGGSGLTLDEMKTQFLGAQEEEIERRADEQFRQLKRGMRSRMPALVRKELMRVLRSNEWPPEIAQVIDSRARQVADEILTDKERWPEWFTTHYLDQVARAVNSKLDSEFEARVQQEAERRLEAMKAGKWRDYVAEKARVLSASLRGGLQELRGTWQFNCDQCGRPIGVEIGPQEVAAMLRGDRIEVECSTCMDPAAFPFIFSTVPHLLGSLSLEQLLRFYIGKAQPE